MQTSSISPQYALESALINIFLYVVLQTHPSFLCHANHTESFATIIFHYSRMLSCLFCTLFWRTQPSHTALFWEPRFHCTGSSFLGIQRNVFLTVVLISLFINVYKNAPTITGWSCNLPELLCDKLQTSSVSRGQMFTRVSNLITAENREKTSKCNLTGCKATGHPLSFYGMGRGGSSEAK